jgi:hypothetical protein
MSHPEGEAERTRPMPVVRPQRRSGWLLALILIAVIGMAGDFLMDVVSTPQTPAVTSAGN